MRVSLLRKSVFARNQRAYPAPISLGVIIQLFSYFFNDFYNRTHADMKICKNIQCKFKYLGYYLLYKYKIMV